MAEWLCREGTMSVTISTQALGLQVSTVLQGWGVVCSNPTRPGCSDSARQSPVLREAREDLLSPEAELPSGASDIHAGTQLPRGWCEQGFECSPLMVSWSITGAQVGPPGRPPLPRAPRCSPPSLPRRMPGAGSPTWGSKAEGVGRAEAAAAHPGGQGRVVLTGAGLVLAGRSHQADVGVQLHKEPALQQPHHHLDELRLQVGRPEVRGGARWDRSGPH